MSTSTGLLVVDVQEKLLQSVFGNDPLCAQPFLTKVALALRAAPLLQLSVLASEQYPQGLGKTAPFLERWLDKECVFAKESFSACRDPHLSSAIKASGCSTWWLCGLEAHICVLQTARDLCQEGYRVVAIKDALASYASLDGKSALQELAVMGVRVTTLETLLFEQLQSRHHSGFKQVSQWIKQSRCGTFKELF